MLSGVCLSFPPCAEIKNHKRPSSHRSNMTHAKGQTYGFQRFYKICDGAAFGVFVMIVRPKPMCEWATQVSIRGTAWEKQIKSEPVERYNQPLATFSGFPALWLLIALRVFSLIKYGQVQTDLVFVGPRTHCTQQRSCVSWGFRLLSKRFPVSNFHQ